MDNEKGIVKLKYSIPIPKTGGGTIDVNQLKMGRLKLKHLRLLPKDFAEREGKVAPAELIPLIAGVADIPVESADEIDIEDVEAIVEGLMSFLADFLQTGEKPSGG